MNRLADWHPRMETEKPMFDGKVIAANSPPAEVELADRLPDIEVEGSILVQRYFAANFLFADSLPRLEIEEPMLA